MIRRKGHFSAPLNSFLKNGIGFVRILSQTTPMTLPMISDRINDLIKKIKTNSEDQDCVFHCVMELAYLEKLRQELKEGDE